MRDFAKPLLIGCGLSAVALLAPAPALAAHPTGAIPAPLALRQSIAQAPTFRDFLPVAVDISRYMPPVGDQGQQASCVGWATAYAARGYYAEQVEHRDTTQPVNQPSPAWIYDITHQGDESCDGGSLIPDAMKVLEQGAYSLADQPYSDTSCTRPPVPARASAIDFRIAGYEQVYDAQGTRELDTIKGALSIGEPVVFIAYVDPQFQLLTDKNDVWVSDMKQPNAGGHAMTLVGYDDRSQTVKFINSWGTEWGDRGFGYMTYATFQARVSEAYVMHLPGDPEITLADADLDPAPIVAPVAKPPAPPPLRPTSVPFRDIGGEDGKAVDVGALSCGRVSVDTDAHGNRIARGFVGTRADLDRLTELLKDRVDENDITLAPWPACELRLTLADALAETDAPKAIVDPPMPKVGDDMRVGVTSPGFASYLYAAYLSADGTVASLLQPAAGAPEAQPPHSAVALGEGDAQLAIVPPAGADSLVVVASERPLFAAPLPASLTAREYLSMLRAAVLSGHAGRIAASLVPVDTQP